jgi:PD-(D/E)XK nuclease superfamily
MSDEITAFSELLRAAGPFLREMRDADILRPPTFNIFRVLGREYREVATHSALLAHLLDPQGGHRQGDLFLRLFLDALRTHETIRGRKFPLLAEVGSGWSCRPEVRLPNGYGQVDILVRAAGFSILIENKIYAGDRPNQLYRYWEYARQLGGYHLLVYITPYGVSPSPSSLLPPQRSESLSRPNPVDNGPENHLALLSYREDIRGMMLRAAKDTEAVSIAEILRQYADLAGSL